MSGTHNALDDAFQRAGGHGMLIPYLTAGYPDREGFVDLAVAVLDAGAGALEIGIPFSDPLLDGPSTQRSQGAALAAGITPPDCLRFAAAIRERSDKPLLFMGAYNPVLASGLEEFCRMAAESGVTAMIIPDLPLEEQGELRAAAGDANMHVIQLVAPTSTSERLTRVCRLASGFIYCVSVTGVTGARTSVATTARPLVARVRACTDVPVAVGFGIAGPEQAREVASFADGVIVGSALIDLVSASDAKERLPAVSAFIRGIADAMQATTIS